MRQKLFCYVKTVGALSLLALGATHLTARAAENAPESDAPIKVLQNRYFLKAMRPEVSLSGGVVLNEAYSSTFGLRSSVGMFLTEYLGVDYSYTVFRSKDSPDLTAIRSVEYCADVACEEKKSLEPSFVRLQGAHTGLITFAPVYSKTSLFSEYILYSDIYFSGGAGLVKSTQGNKSAFVVGLGQRFYFAKSFNLRIDGWDYIFQEDRQNRGEVKKNTRHAWFVSLGASVFLLKGEEK